MTYVIKVGNQYVGQNGELVDRQRDAIKIAAPADASKRIVKIRPRT